MELHANLPTKKRLHTLFRSPYQTDIDIIMLCVAPQDAILLLQDGVIAALAQVDIEARLLEQGVPVYALRADVEARGLVAQISTSIPLIDYTEFVRLTAKYAVQLAW
ncbi:MAG: sulfurtransferase complex subunit TusB [Candidatus Malihini olakiniferum]